MCPTAKESGGGDIDVVSWNGMVVKAGTPPAIVAQLNKATREVLTDADLKKRFAALGLTADPTSPEELAAFFKADMAKWAAVVEANKIPKQ